MAAQGNPNLPNELVAQISSYVWPGDIANFSSVSERFHALSEGALKDDEEKQQQYANLSISDQNSLSICQVLEEPRAAFYVKRILFTKRRYSYRDWQSDGQNLHTIDPTRKYQGYYTEKRLNEIRNIMTVLRDSPFIPQNQQQKDQWIDEIKRGDDAALKMIVLTLCPNITHLCVTAHKSFTTGFVKYLSDAIASSIVSPNPNMQPILADLSELRIGHEVRNILPRVQDRLFMHDIAPFMTVPFLELFFFQKRCCAAAD